MSITNIQSPADLKKLPKDEIPGLCEEIRNVLIETVGRTGGHLASNLGAVELTVAVHRVFDSPKDHIIFDVGHQSYVHKMLTGRADRFDTLRKPGGLSGFTNREESPHDAFGTGHSSTSLSAALGFAYADKLAGNEAFTVAIVGDGAYTGGMIHEALNNVKSDLPLIIILNENGMSISKNRGAFARYLTRVRVSSSYMGFKKGTKTFLHKIPLIGRPLEKAARWTRDRLVNRFYPMNYFENLGLYYIGVIDGNNEEAVENALQRAKEIGKCTVIHLRTKKGLGYAPAEAHPDLFHGVSAESSCGENFHAVFAEELCKIAEKNPKTVAVTAAMGQGTGLSSFGLKYPDRMFDVGIAEEHALTFSAGLSAAGMEPYAVIYSTFLQRAYDNVLHDVALQRLPMRLIIDRAGLAVCDGATHHGIFDVAFLSEIPGVKIYAPISFGSLRTMMNHPYPKDGTVEAIRYPNAGENDEVVATFYPKGEYQAYGVSADFPKDNSMDAVLITYGNETARVLKAEKMLKQKGLSVGTVVLEQITPYKDVADRIAPFASGAKQVFFIEEGIRNGGAAVNLESSLTGKFGGNLPFGYHIRAIEEIPKPTEVCDLYEYLGFSAEKIAEFVSEILGNR
ncbi:MAG: 1-deoxy-D-xylulose-5-phosphate synthase [Clostridia bacterium]|nr:1-deoxy-D-xylulose-5-phosphate synthase [Clostridia bacterium]